MEGERIAKSLAIYFDKYRDLLEKNRKNAAVNHNNNNNSNGVSTAPSSSNDKAETKTNGDCKEPTETLTAKTTKVIPARKSDGKLVKLSDMNDYTSTKVKEEAAMFEAKRALETIPLCPGCLGGSMDNPKVVTAGVGNVVEKWDLAYRALKRSLQTSDGPVESFALTRCSSYDDIIPSDEDIDIHCLNPTSLCETLNEGAEKLILHGTNMAKILMEAGEVQLVSALIGSIVLARNQLAFFQSDLVDGLPQENFNRNSSKASMEASATEQQQQQQQQVQEVLKKPSFKKSTLELTELAHAITAQLQDYHSHMISTTILHDGESQDWTNNAKLYFEGERISVPIQFWGFHMQGLRGDLFNSLPPSIARRTLAKAVDDSLGVLTFRYCQITPGFRRMCQFRGDVTAILLIAHDLLLSISTTMATVFNPATSGCGEADLVRGIHAKCSILLSVLVVVGSPIRVASRALDAAMASNALNKEPTEIKSGGDDNRRLVQWLHLVLPGIYPSPVTNPQKLSSSSFLHLLGRMTATQPEPDWPSLVRLCLSRKMEFSALIMRNFGAFIPGGGETNHSHHNNAAEASTASSFPTFSKSMREGCGNLLCAKRCLGVADIFWPQVVGSGILYIVMHGNPEKQCLVKVLEPLLRKLSPASWDILNANVMWNAKRPVWFQALLDLLEPYFHPIFDELMDDLEAGRTWTLSHVPEAISKMNGNILDIAHLIPASFYQICELIEDLLPDEVRPSCDSVVAHLFISCIYGVINKLIPVFREWKMQREKVDFLVAVGEKLCNMESGSTEMQKLEGLTDASNNVKSERNHRWDDVDEDFAETISEMLKEEFLCDPYGQEALKAIYRFVSYNSEWLQKSLGVSVSPPGMESSMHPPGSSAGQRGVSSATEAKLVPWSEKTFKQINVYDMMEYIGQIRYSGLLDHPHAWEETLKYLASTTSPHLLLRLLRRRPEVEDANVPEADKAAFIEAERILLRATSVDR